MADQLNNEDYMTILNYYGIPLDKSLSNTDIKNKAEHILADKLCKCIKNVQKKSKTLKESRAIAICRDAVLHKKGIETAGFTCKKKKTFISKKGSTHKLYKLKYNTKGTKKRKSRKSKKFKLVNN
jgi:hypothetical protein